MYSVLKGEELDEGAEERNPGEIQWKKREPLLVVYNEKVPIEFFVYNYR
jgi:type I restriction enzyme R subunit